MKVEKVKLLEDCFDGSFIKEVLFDHPVTKRFIDYLAEQGELEYLSTLEKPFYKIEQKGKYIIKGIQGNKTARIILYRKNIKQSLNWFKKYVTLF